MKKTTLLGTLALMSIAGVSTACGGNSSTSVAPSTSQPTTTSVAPSTTSVAPTTTSAPAKKLKVGLICLHGESSSYDKNFIDAFKAACAARNLVLDTDAFIKTGIDEDNNCYVAAKEWAEDGFDYIFADSFGHEDFILQAASEYPDTHFSHATGTQAHTSNLPNFSNAFASIYEGRYLAGVVAGQKMLEDIEAKKYTRDQAKIGYVGAHPYAEVISGYTSFYLGARSVLPEVTMDVAYTNSWYDYDVEKSTAATLITNGAKLISQHADSYGAPEACNNAGVPNVTYNLSTKETYGDTYLVGSKINWQPYFEYCFDALVNGTEIETDWTGVISGNSVQVLEFGNGVSDAAKQKMNDAKAALAAGTLKVFDCSKFTCTKAKNPYNDIQVDGEGHVTSFMADVDSDPGYVGDTQVCLNGAILESTFRSAPYFSLIIEGITELSD